MLVSLALSIISIVIVIFLMVALRRQVTNQYHAGNDQGIEVSAIVSEYSQRMRRLEESLVDQKVKLEILELRVQRSPERQVRAEVPVSRSYERFEPNLENEAQPAPDALKRAGEPLKLGQKVDSDKHLGSTEREALRLVFEGRGGTTAKDIQQKIGRTREHTARMMNSLFQEGLVERNISVRPFAYSITQKGRDLLNS